MAWFLRDWSFKKTCLVFAVGAGLTGASVYYISKRKRDSSKAPDSVEKTSEETEKPDPTTKSEPADFGTKGDSTQGPTKGAESGSQGPESLGGMSSLSSTGDSFVVLDKDSSLPAEQPIKSQTTSTKPSTPTPPPMSQSLTTKDDNDIVVVSPATVAPSAGSTVSQTSRSSTQAAPSQVSQPAAARSLPKKTESLPVTKPDVSARGDGGKSPTPLDSQKPGEVGKTPTPLEIREAAQKTEVKEKPEKKEECEGGNCGTPPGETVNGAIEGDTPGARSEGSVKPAGSLNEAMQGDTPGGKSERGVKPAIPGSDAIQGDSPSARSEESVKPAGSLNEAMQGDSPGAKSERGVKPTESVSQAIQGVTPSANLEGSVKPSESVNEAIQSDIPSAKSDTACEEGNSETS